MPSSISVDPVLMPFERWLQADVDMAAGAANEADGVAVTVVMADASLEDAAAPAGLDADGPAKAAGEAEVLEDAAVGGARSTRHPAT